jgi:predicted MPP superfamily phosphohydrolase
LTYATRIEPTWLELNHLHIPIANLPAPFAGLRIVQMSDFHGGRQVTPAYLGEAVDLAQAPLGLGARRATGSPF